MKKQLKNISYAAVAALMVTSASSCKKFLDEENPHTLTIESGWNSAASFIGLVNAAYSELHLFYGQEDGAFLLETGTDLWYSAGRNGYARQIVYYDGLLATQGQPTKAWTSCYKSINLCNAAIGRVDQIPTTAISADEKKMRLGEAYFLRAFYYFNLVEQFGPVTLITKETTEVNLQPVRSSIEEVYDLIISDLLTAKENLPLSWPAAEYSRASKKSAMGMLAKVYLQRAYYSSGSDAQAWFTKAKNAALEVIDNQTSLGVSLYPTLNEIGQSVYGPAADRAKNKEALFVTSFDENNATLNALTGANGNRIYKYFITKYTARGAMQSAFVPAYGADGESRMMPTWHFLDLYDETKDARYNTWFQEVWIANQNYTWKIADTSVASTYGKDPSIVGKVNKLGDTALWCTKAEVPFNRDTARYLVAGRNHLYINPIKGQPAAIVNNKTTTNYYPSFRKYVNQKRTYTGTTDFGDAMILRLSEIYMIAAEAYMQLGDQTNAAKYVNFITKRAAITPGALDVAPGQVTIEYLLNERAREFAGELIRWYDLKRVFHNKDQWAQYIKYWNPDQTQIQPYHWLRPVPDKEVTASANPKDFVQNDGYPK